VGQEQMKKNGLLISVIFFITLSILSKSSIVGLGESLKKLKASFENIAAKLTKKDPVQTTVNSLQTLLDHKNPEQIETINIYIHKGGDTIIRNAFFSNENYSNLTSFDISIYEIEPYHRKSLFEVIQPVLTKSINCKHLSLNLGNKKGGWNPGGKLFKQIMIPIFITDTSKTIKKISTLEHLTSLSLKISAALDSFFDITTHNIESTKMNEYIINQAITTLCGVISSPSLQSLSSLSLDVSNLLFHCTKQKIGQLDSENTQGFTQVPQEPKTMHDLLDIIIKLPNLLYFDIKTEGMNVQGIDEKDKQEFIDLMNKKIEIIKLTVKRNLSRYSSQSRIAVVEDVLSGYLDTDVYYLDVDYPMD
jgi:hypothetical protein